MALPCLLRRLRLPRSSLFNRPPSHPNPPRPKAVTSHFQSRKHMCISKFGGRQASRTGPKGDYPSRGRRHEQACSGGADSLQMHWWRPDRRQSRTTRCPLCTRFAAMAAVWSAHCSWVGATQPGAALRRQQQQVGSEEVPMCRWRAAMARGAPRCTGQRLTLVLPPAPLPPPAGAPSPAYGAAARVQGRGEQQRLAGGCQGAAATAARGRGGTCPGAVQL